ncbi:hypothetical protein DFH06DRAFT_1227843 [Mycena polygramma]|nr:hypothetical protein DFH06DRAFT_1227843 [Mycena polygramma]
MRRAARVPEHRAHPARRWLRRGARRLRRVLDAGPAASHSSRLMSTQSRRTRESGGGNQAGRCGVGAAIEAQRKRDERREKEGEGVKKREQGAYLTCPSPRTRAPSPSLTVSAQGQCTLHSAAQLRALIAKRRERERRATRAIYSQTAYRTSWRIRGVGVPACQCPCSSSTASANRLRMRCAWVRPPGKESAGIGAREGRTRRPWSYLCPGRDRAAQRLKRYRMKKRGMRRLADAKSGVQAGVRGESMCAVRGCGCGGWRQS